MAEEIKLRLLEEVKRYRMNIELILSIKYLIENNLSNLKLCPPLNKIKLSHSNKYKEPDLIIHDTNRNFLINEIKTSISPSEEDINQIKDYLNISVVLDYNGNDILCNNYSVNLIVNIESYNNVINYLFNKIDEKLRKDLSITSFSHLESVPKYGMRFYLFELRDNETIFDNLNKILRSRPKIFVSKFEREGEQLYFIDNPKPQYTIVILWMFILPIIRNEDNIFNIVNIEEMIKNYYGKWNDNRVFFKKKWIRDSLKSLCDIKWIKKITENEYEIIKSFIFKGDLTETVCRKLAELEFQEIIAQQEREGRREGIQIQLDRFFNQ